MYDRLTKKDIEKMEQEMRAPTCFRWVHFRNVGGGFLLPKITITVHIPLQSIWIPAGIPTSHRQHPNIW